MSDVHEPRNAWWTGQYDESGNPTEGADFVRCDFCKTLVSRLVPHIICKRRGKKGLACFNCLEINRLEEQVTQQKNTNDLYHARTKVLERKLAKLEDRVDERDAEIKTLFEKEA